MGIIFGTNFGTTTGVWLIHMRAEYNRIRVFIGSVLRQLSVVQESSGDPIAFLFLDNITLEIKENDSTANGVLEVLIREGRITAQMATSLMNDSAYVYDVTKNLVQMGGVLLAAGDLLTKEAERALALDADQIEEMAESITNYDRVEDKPRSARTLSEIFQCDRRADRHERRNEGGR